MLRNLLTVVLLAAVTLAGAQSVDNYSLRVDVELVQLPVSVLDKKGLPVQGLRVEHFNVFEDKVQQEISLFKQEDIPLSVVLLIDTSGSMNSKMDRLHAAAMAFLKESNPDDETAIISFGDDSDIEQDFTQDAGKLNLALSRMRSRQNTALYDAVHFAAAYLENNGTHEKKVLLVISDGEDNHSQRTFKAVLAELRESKVTVYSVGLLSSGMGYSYYSYNDDGKKVLKQFAASTGGAAHFPNKLQDIDGLCAKIARELRSQYTLGYRPTNTSLDGSWRKVVVKVDPPRNVSKVQVRTKPGYYAPEPAR
jgi:VWFA-related protein